MLGDSDPANSVVITGAFSYTGKYATRLLLDRGYKVRTLTFHPHRENPFAAQVQTFPYNFDRPSELTETLRGASTLINTYWVRFPRGKSNFETAVQHTRTLIRAAKEAEIKRIVDVSIANPSLESRLGYYRGKALLEQAIVESGLSYAILRPAVIFGCEDVLINNIAWFVRRFPVFPIPGDGRYGVRPIYVDDMARLIANAVEQQGDSVLDAVGPESFTFEELVRLIAGRLGRKVRLVHVPAPLAYAATLLTGWFVRDVILTWQEYEGLMSNLLACDSPSTGRVRLSQWLAEHRQEVGRQYASEAARHFAERPSNNGS